MYTYIWNIVFLFHDIKENHKLYPNVLGLFRDHAEKYFLYLVNPSQILIVITLFRFIQKQTEFRLVPNKLEKRYYIKNLVLNKTKE